MDLFRCHLEGAERCLKEAVAEVRDVGADEVSAEILFMSVKISKWRRAVEAALRYERGPQRKKRW